MNTKCTCMSFPGLGRCEEVCVLRGKKAQRGQSGDRLDDRLTIISLTTLNT